MKDVSIYKFFPVYKALSPLKIVMTRGAAIWCPLKKLNTLFQYLDLPMISPMFLDTTWQPWWSIFFCSEFRVLLISTLRKASWVYKCSCCFLRISRLYLLFCIKIDIYIIYFAYIYIYIYIYIIGKQCMCYWF